MSSMNSSKQESIHVQQAILRHQAEEQHQAVRDLCSWGEEMKKKQIVKSSRNSSSTTTKTTNMNTTMEAQTSPTTTHQRDSLSSSVPSNHSSNISSNISSTKVKIHSSSNAHISKLSLQEKTELHTHSRGSCSSHQNENDNNNNNNKNNNKYNNYNETTEDSERVRGNTFYAAGKYEEAIKAYSKCIQINSQAVLAFSNRAMAYLKIKDWIHAEQDATSAIELDPFHLKSYQRRSAARAALGKIRAALHDLNMAEIAASQSGNGIPKEMELERIKLEKMLQEAMDKAPRRQVPIQRIENPVMQKKKDPLPRKDSNSTSPHDHDHVHVVSSHKEDVLLVPIQSTVKHPSSIQEGVTVQATSSALSTTTTTTTTTTSTSRMTTDTRNDLTSQKTCTIQDSIPKESDRIQEENKKKQSHGDATHTPIDPITPLSPTRNPSTLPPFRSFKTWYEFELIWRSLPPSSPSSRIDLLRRLKPPLLTHLYKRNGMEDSSIFYDLVLSASELKNGVEYLSAIANIPSIDIVVMMLSPEEKEHIQKAIRTCVQSQLDSSVSEEYLLSKLS